MTIHNLVSFLGIFVLIGLAWAISTNRRVFNWRVVVWGLALQMALAVFVFLVPAGTKVFLFLNEAVVKLLDSASAGSRFLFGPLATPPGQVSEAGEPSLGFILAFQGFPTIIFFSALMSILYFCGIMQRVIRGFAFLFTRLMRVSGAESLCAASNIFVGVESSLTIRPHLSSMTPSELCTVLTAGMATVASNVMALYVYSLQSRFPNIAGHLISASFLSAPAALLMSKIVLPETGHPKTLGRTVDMEYQRESSLFESIINGANSGLRLIFGIAALLVAVLGLVALVDLLLGWAGGWVNGRMGWGIDWTLKGLLGYLFYPLTVVLGVPLSDAGEIAKIIGERVVATEVKSYQDLALLLADGRLHDPRSSIVATYALCGFAHVASMAIFVGGLSALAPERTRDIGRAGVRALIAATLACLLTACVAGTFLTRGSLLLGP